jgi:CRP-like cAMP-binding protein
MAGREEIVATLSQFTLFADLNNAQLEAIAGQLDEAWFAQGTRILRQGLSGSGLYFVIDGLCAVEVNHQERARLGRGEYFGEMSVLLHSPPSADVIAVHQARCLVLAAPAVETFLVSYPRLMYRMLQVQARRLHAANTWRS